MDFDLVSFDREEKSKALSFLTLLLKFQLKAVMGAQGGSVP